MTRWGDLRELRWQSRLILILWLLGLVLLGALAAKPAYVHFAGELVTAQVQRCETAHGTKWKHTTCYGSWTTADGEEHRGEIGGAGRMSEGQEEAVRVTAFFVEVDDPTSMWPIIPFCLYLLVLVFKLPPWLRYQVDVDARAGHWLR